MFIPEDLIFAIKIPKTGSPTEAPTDLCSKKLRAQIVLVGGRQLLQLFFAAFFPSKLQLRALPGGGVG